MTLVHGPVLAGKPIDNTSVYIVRPGSAIHGGAGAGAKGGDGDDGEVADLAAGLDLVPIGVPGEVVFGRCVAHGYLDRPDATAANFLLDPFPEARGSIENKHSTDVESPPPPPPPPPPSSRFRGLLDASSQPWLNVLLSSPPSSPPRSCTSIHPEAKSCSDLGSSDVLNDPPARLRRCPGVRRWCSARATSGSG
jgi:hypothetical protein